MTHISSHEDTAMHPRHTETDAQMGKATLEGGGPLPTSYPAEAHVGSEDPPGSDERKMIQS